MKTFRPVIEEAMVVRFSKNDLLAILERLEESGADEIGVTIKED